jgi:hypothetical protein
MNFHRIVDGVEHCCDFEVIDHKTGKTVVRYQLTVDAGENPQTGRRQQVRRRCGTEKQARAALAEITEQASKGIFVPRKAVTVKELCHSQDEALRDAGTSLGGVVTSS